jgi:hypothetical protein
MSKVVEIKIEDISKGWSPAEYLAGEGNYLNSIAIDPELPITDSKFKPSGVIRPTAYEKFSGDNINNHPVSIVTTPKNALIYVLLSNGRFLSYDADYANETLIGTVTGSAGHCAWYQADYIYLLTDTDLSRYGPLSGTPSLSNTIWSSTFSLTALTSNTYPSLLGTGQYPKHWAWLHQDDKGYITDYKDGKGMLHFLKTAATGGTNDGSTYEALDLPQGFLPVSGCSFGEDVVAAAVQTTSSSVIQGSSALFFWDTVDTSFYRRLDVPGIVTHVFNLNGILCWFAGSLSGKGGYSLYALLGERQYEPLVTVPEGFPPPAGAVEVVGSRVIWGSFLSEPENACVLLSYGSKDGRLAKGLHCVGRSTLTHTATDGMLTALKWVKQGTISRPELIMGGKNQTSSEYYLEKISTTYQTSYFRSRIINLGQEFTVKYLKIPLGVAVGENMTIIPKVYLDNEASSAAFTTINNTNHSGKKKVRVYSQAAARGETNFFLELKFTGTALCPVLLPITIGLEIHDD